MMKNLGWLEYRMAGSASGEKGLGWFKGMFQVQLRILSVKRIKNERVF